MSKAQIVETHCSEAAFLWRLRDHAARDGAYSLQRLGDLDERLDAHLDGLVLAGAEGWAACASALESPTPGGVFVALFVALSRRDGAALAHHCRDGAAVPRVLEVAADAPALLRAAAAALAWRSTEDLVWLLPYLLEAGAAADRQYLGLTASALHRYDLGASVISALSKGSPLLCARALRACGELRQRAAFSELARSYDAGDVAQRYWASWAGSLLGDAHAPERLLAICRGGGPHAERACETAMRRLDLAAARQWLEWLAVSSQPRAAIAGAGALGDPALVPLLLELMALPKLARLAAEAIHRITGLDFGARQFRARAPDGFQARPSDDPEEEDVDLDPDDSLPWPDRRAAEIWWRGARAQLQAGTRYLLGKPLSEPQWLEAVLREGSQPTRAAAAEELAMRGARGSLFEVRARASRQLEACANG